MTFAVSVQKHKCVQWNLSKQTGYKLMGIRMGPATYGLFIQAVSLCNF